MIFVIRFFVFLFFSTVTLHAGDPQNSTEDVSCQKEEQLTHDFYDWVLDKMAPRIIRDMRANPQTVVPIYIHRRLFLARLRRDAQVADGVLREGWRLVIDEIILMPGETLEDRLNQERELESIRIRLENMDAIVPQEAFRTWAEELKTVFIAAFLSYLLVMLSNIG